VQWGPIEIRGFDVRDRDRLFIDGDWVQSTGDAVIDVENPATEEVVARVPAGTAEDVDRAVSAARAAFGWWSTTSVG